MGAHDRAPDGLPSERFVPRGHGGEICQPSDHAASENIGEVGGDSHADAVASRNADTAGSGAGSRRNAARGLGERSRRSAGVDRFFWGVAYVRSASGVWGDEPARLADVGLPAPGSSFAAI